MNFESWYALGVVSISVHFCARFFLLFSYSIETLISFPYHTPCVLCSRRRFLRPAVHSEANVHPGIVVGFLCFAPHPIRLVAKGNVHTTLFVKVCIPVCVPVWAPFVRTYLTLLPESLFWWRWRAVLKKTFLHPLFSPVIRYLRINCPETSIKSSNVSEIECDSAKSRSFNTDFRWYSVMNRPFDFLVPGPETIDNFEGTVEYKSSVLKHLRISLTVNKFAHSVYLRYTHIPSSNWNLTNSIERAVWESIRVWQVGWWTSSELRCPHKTVSQI